MLYGRAGNWFNIPLFIALVVLSVVAGYWRFVLQWLNGIRGRDWAHVSATIDVVSVAPQLAENVERARVTGYLATLTYFYRNPELQVGEYTRLFTVEAEAQSWAASCKGSTVMVHVDPRDPSRSVLRKEELPM